jgi:hypothetical protein
MAVTRKRKKKEKDIIDQMLDTIDFRGLTQDEVIDRDGIIIHAPFSGADTK